jgi:hypothetical protein
VLNRYSDAGPVATLESVQFFTLPHVTACCRAALEEGAMMSAPAAILRSWLKGAPPCTTTCDNCGGDQLEFDRFSDGTTGLTCQACGLIHTPFCAPPFDASRDMPDMACGPQGDGAPPITSKRLIALADAERGKRDDISCPHCLHALPGLRHRCPSDDGGE